MSDLGSAAEQPAALAGRGRGLWIPAKPAATMTAAVPTPVHNRLHAVTALRDQDCGSA
ncbi:hypothetical protein AB0C65_36715 [Nocardia sp. NPDC048505]|uniref:hypothetical protein n=1 Tax=Nocardia sp. NPDC048505 TaxID=3155756 RepID=UPI0033FF6365